MKHDPLETLLNALSDLIACGRDRHAFAVLYAIYQAADRFSDPEGASGRTCLDLAEAAKDLIAALEPAVLPTQQHVCGLQGFGAVGDVCSACEANWRRANVR